MGSLFSARRLKALQRNLERQREDLRLETTLLRALVRSKIAPSPAERRDGLVALALALEANGITRKELLRAARKMNGNGKGKEVSCPS